MLSKNDVERLYECVREIRTLSKNDVERLYECAECDYYKQCIHTVPEPSDNPDGTCKTKDEFERMGEKED